jgi:hypothetical protein
MQDDLLSYFDLRNLNPYAFVFGFMCITYNNKLKKYEIKPEAVLDVYKMFIRMNWDDHRIVENVAPQDIFRYARFIMKKKYTS